MPLPFALIDCNNFFVSCVRVHEPALKKKPVVVLSNNDGCFISCSPEAKALGLPRGGTAFKFQDIIKKHDVVVKSANFTLFSDISDRIYRTLEMFSPEVEKYSIDESFLHLPEKVDPKVLGKEVYRYTRIPVTVGVGKTKTLAKAANHIAKRNALFKGALSLPGGEDDDELLTHVDVDKIWGIGRRWAVKLKELGIETAAELKHARDALIKQRLNIVGLRVVHELRGMPCIELEEVIPDKQQMMCCRSFSRPIETYDEMKQAVAFLTSTVAERLRSENQVAAGIQVYLTTKKFGAGPHYSNSYGFLMPEATSFTPRMVQYAQQCLKRIYRSGYKYRRAGIFLSGLNNNRFLQLDIFDGQQAEQHLSLMEALDRINTRYGRDTIFIGAVGTERRWLSRSSQKPPSYTTQWSDLVSVRG